MLDLALLRSILPANLLYSHFAGASPHGETKFDRGQDG